MRNAFSLGIDVGGTFTDFVLTDGTERIVGQHKVLTTPDRPARAIEEGTRALLTRTGTAPSDVGAVIHGTTLATNAIIERKGAITGLLTTRGFRDILEMGSEQRYDIHDLFLRFPDPIVPRHARLEIDERLAHDGSVLRPLLDDDVRAQARALVADGVRSIAIVFLHSYADARHEARAATLIREIAPDVPVSLSHAVAPELREYERASTTVANAYVQPLVAAYVRDLVARLAALGIHAPLLLMQSDGGSTSAEVASELPVRILESGPAGGVLAAVHQAAAIGATNIVSFDMGGTTAKICLLREGAPARTSLLEVARVERFKPGSGLPIRTPAIDLLEIGGGGGSIARVDRLGLLKVGPDSAGAEPGPASYGRAGSDARPTVTDAALILGYLSPDMFLGGRMTLDANAARRAVSTLLAEPLGIGVEEAAWGVFSVVSENMASAARIHCIEHGVDPRSCTLFAFGGAGPVHASRIASILRMPRVVCPPGAGVMSAFGFLVAPLSFSESRSLPGILDDHDVARVNVALAEMEASARAKLAAGGASDDGVRIAREADCSLLGQSHELPVPVPSGEIDAAALEGMARSFHEVYRSRYGHAAPEGAPVQVLTWRVTAAQDRARAASVPRPARAVRAAARGERPAYFPETGGFTATAVYRRADLAAGSELRGPAIVEEDEATTVIAPGQRAAIDGAGALVIVLRETLS